MKKKQQDKINDDCLSAIDALRTEVNSKINKPMMLESLTEKYQDYSTAQIKDELETTKSELNSFNALCDKLCKKQNDIYNDSVLDAKPSAKTFLFGGTICASAFAVAFGISSDNAISALYSFGSVEGLVILGGAIDYILGEEPIRKKLYSNKFRKVYEKILALDMKVDYLSTLYREKKLQDNTLER